MYHRLVGRMCRRWEMTNADLLARRSVGSCCEFCRGKEGPMAARRRVWVWVVAWALVGDGLLFVPWLVARGVAGVRGAAGGTSTSGIVPSTCSPEMLSRRWAGGRSGGCRWTGWRSSAFGCR